MRIGLNLLHAQPEIGGGWNYIANLLGGLAEHPGDHEYLAFVTPQSDGIVPAHPRFCRVQLPVRPASRVQRILFENTRLPGLARMMRVDVLHWFSNTHAPLCRIPSVVTVYDLLAFSPVAPWGAIKLAYLRSMIGHTIRSANMLVPISQATAADIGRRFAVEPGRMLTVPSVLPSQFKPAAEADVSAFKRAFDLPQQYWIYVANFRTYKGHATLIEAYRLLVARRDDRGWPLVLRGDGDERIARLRRQQVADLGLQGKVVFLPRLPESDMAALYSGAGGLVFPSTFEGLGIPVLEAMACGCPVIGAALPSVTESGGDAILTVDARSAEALATGMAALTGDPARREDMRRRGLARASLFRADVVVPQLLSAYGRAA